MLGPVAFGEEEAVAPGVLHKGGHHIVVLAVFGAVLGELQGGAVAAGGAPEGAAGADGEAAGDGVGGADAAVVVAAFQVVPAFQHEAGAGAAGTDGLGGDDDGGGHTAGGVHGELDIGQFGHIFQDPLGAELADAVQGVVGGVEGVDDIHRNGGIGGPVGAGGGDGDQDQAVHLVGGDAGVGDGLAQGADAQGPHGGFGPAVPAAGGGGMADADGGDFAAVFPNAQAFGRTVH